MYEYIPSFLFPFVSAAAQVAFPYHLPSTRGFLVEIFNTGYSHHLMVSSLLIFRTIPWSPVKQTKRVAVGQSLSLLGAYVGVIRQNQPSFGEEVV